MDSPRFSPWIRHESPMNSLSPHGFHQDSGREAPLSGGAVADLHLCLGEERPEMVNVNLEKPWFFIVVNSGE